MKQRALLRTLVVCLVLAALPGIPACTQSSNTPGASSNSMTPDLAAKAASKRAPPKSITIWETISDMNTKDKKIPKAIADLLGKEIELAGFIILNEADSDDMKEFLITPISGGCVHVPPPPPNYIIHVVMPNGMTTKYVSGPVLVNGILRVPKKQEDRKFYTLELEGHQVGPFQRGDDE